MKTGIWIALLNMLGYTRSWPFVSGAAMPNGVPGLKRRFGKGALPDDFVGYIVSEGQILWDLAADRRERIAIAANSHRLILDIGSAVAAKGAEYFIVHIPSLFCGARHTKRDTCAKAGLLPRIVGGIVVVYFHVIGNQGHGSYSRVFDTSTATWTVCCHQCIDKGNCP